MKLIDTAAFIEKVKSAEKAGEETKGIYTTVDYLINEYGELVEAEPKWIPCSERLLDFGVDVLVCNDEGIQVTAKRTGWSIDPNCWAINYCGYDYDSWDFILNGDIVAWMELPKPYERKEG